MEAENNFNFIISIESSYLIHSRVHLKHGNFTSVLRKYSGPVDIWLSSYFARCNSRGDVLCLINEHPLKSFSAMAQHMSQWVWFRKLFVTCSSYTYVNTLSRIAIN
uniref:N-acetylglucosaminylphosphatidylinositol deacetylase n=1 Tax=Opuntia streptacantha TaxID=393608 RepID=A0A7C9AAB3_OPUST